MEKDENSGFIQIGYFLIIAGFIATIATYFLLNNTLDGLLKILTAILAGLIPTSFGLGVIAHCSQGKTKKTLNTITLILFITWCIALFIVLWVASDQLFYGSF